MSNELKWHEMSLCMDGPTWLESTVIGFVSGPSGTCLHQEGKQRRAQHTKNRMMSLRK